MMKKTIPDWLEANSARIIQHMNEDHSKSIVSTLHAQHDIKDSKARMEKLTTDGYYVLTQGKLLFLSFENRLLKEVFVFDYFNNSKKNEIKIGFRFIFQSTESTVTDVQVNEVINEVITSALKIESISIPGLS